MKPQKNKKTAVKKPKKSFWKKPEKVTNINSEDYIKPKNDIGGKILSVMLWCALGLLMVRGAIAFMQPNPLEEMQRRTDSFIKEQTAQTNLSYEIQSFAQNFAKEYLTYQAGRRDDFLNRLNPYITSHVVFSDIQNFRSNVTATYLQAYKLQPYNENQFDVYVMAAVEYEFAPSSSDDPVRIERENTYLKIPVRVLEPGKYVVEDYPAFVAAPDGYEYTAAPFIARELDKVVNDQVKQILSNFFTAYYQENQTRIEYFLSASADKSAFKGLNGRYRFKEIRSLHSYADPMNAQRILSLVELVIEDHNGQQLIQRFNVLINNDGDRFYIVEMDTKTVDIKYNFSIQQ